MSVENRNTIITGTTGGLGRVVTKKFAEQGARLVPVNTNNEKLEQLVEEFNLAEDRFLGLITDLSQPAAAQDVTDRTLAKFGSIDIASSSLCQRVNDDQRGSHPLVWQLVDW